MLSRCCFHHLVENSILYKKDIQHFYIGLILFSENQNIRSVVGGKADGQFLFGAGVETENFYLVPGVRKRKIYLMPNDSYENFYLAVKGIMS